MAANNRETVTINIPYGIDETYQIFPLLTSVCMFSTDHILWLLGEITVVNTSIRAEDGHIESRYTVHYEDGTEEELSHEQVTERIQRGP